MSLVPERVEDLKSWQEARNLVEIVSRLTTKEASGWDRGLVRDLRAGAVVSMSYIAEAHRQPAPPDKRRSLDSALRSCKEVQSLLCVALDHAYLQRDEFDEAFRQAEVVSDLLKVALNYLPRQGDRKSSPSPKRSQGIQ